MSKSVSMVVAGLALLGASWMGCGGSDGASGTIGPAGGTVTSSNGASVTVPAGALSTSVAIVATALADPTAPPSTTVVGAAVTLGPEGQQFSAPVTVTLPVDATLLPAGKTTSAIVIYTAPAGTTTYAQLATTVVDATHVSAKVSHFSNFVPGVPGGCVTNNDCMPGQSCVAGVCLGSCATNSDCMPGHVCVSGQCK